MINFTKNILLLFIVLISACQADQPTENNQPTEKIATSTEVDSSASKLEHPKSFTLLVFKEEKKAELWLTTKDGQKTKHKEVSTILSKKAPVGIFQFENAKAEELKLAFPNAFYKRKSLKHLTFLDQDVSLGTTLAADIIFPKALYEEIKEFLKKTPEYQVIIFPNDIREESTFIPCLRCPNWMAEVYTRLELKIKEYHE